MSAVTRFNPADLAAPASPYSHGVLAPAGARTLYTAGQVGVSADGKVPESIEEQLDVTWDNIDRILRDGGMKRENIVHTRGYLVRAGDLGAYRSAFRARLGEVRPASTLVIVAALVVPQLLVEIEAVAVG